MPPQPLRSSAREESLRFRTPPDAPSAAENHPERTACRRNEAQEPENAPQLLRSSAREESLRFRTPPNSVAAPHGRRIAAGEGGRLPRTGAAAAG